jgi:hypothetical protein
MVILSRQERRELQGYDIFGIIHLNLADLGHTPHGSTQISCDLTTPCVRPTIPTHAGIIKHREIKSASYWP